MLLTFTKTLACAAALAAAIGTAAVAQTELVLAHVFPATSREQEAAQVFADKVGEITGGDVTVSIFPASQLGGWSQIANQQQSGAVNITFISTSALGGFTPLATVDVWPFLFKSRAEFDQAYASQTAKDFLAAIEADSGYRVLSPVYKGARFVYVAKDADSLNGLKIRVPGLPVVTTAFEAWGASPTPMDVAELYTAMQQGVVDGVEIEAQTAQSMGLADITKTVLLTRHMTPNYAFIVWGAWLDSLPADQKAAVEQAAAEASAFFGDGIEDAEKAALDAFAAAGAKLVEPDVAGMEAAAETAETAAFPELADWAAKMRAAATAN